LTVYTSADPSVLPPVMIRPMLPASPPAGVPPDQIGTLDLLIDETGNVEQVKLSSPANRYQERMLVSHVKTWKFKPAMREGQPVKYRTRVRVTI
jgi:TonB family protein